MKRVYPVLVMAVLVLGSGCASMVSQTHYTVPINSNPAGATVVVRDVRGNNVFEGKTPAAPLLAAGAGYFIPASYAISFTKEGYQPTTAVVAADTDPWYAMNFFFGPFCWVGWFIIDPKTGAMWELNRSVFANLAPVAMGQGTNAAPQTPVQAPPSTSTTTVTAPTPAPVLLYPPPPVYFPPPPVFDLPFFFLPPPRW